MVSLHLENDEETVSIAKDLVTDSYLLTPRFALWDSLPSCWEEMVSLEEVLNLKRDELGLFLRDRGIPYNSRNRGDRLTQATNALEQDIPLTPSVN